MFKFNTSSIIARWQSLIIRLTITAVFLISVSVYMFSNPGGISGVTNSGCYCHNSQNNATSVSVTAESGSFTVAPGSTTNYTVSISNSGYNYYGVDIGVKTTQTGETNAGTFSNLGTGLRSTNGELVHSSAKNGTGGVTYTFSWTAPTTPGTYYLRVAGQGVNNTGNENGDQWKVMTPQAITVVGTTQLTLSSPNGGENLCPGGQTAITWSSSGVTNVKIDLSTDGGSTFPTTLVASTAASTGTWTWNISASQAAGTNYKVKISDASNQTMNSVSNASFSIVGQTSISAHPQPLTVCTGQPAVFNVTASGPGLSYSWKLNNVAIPNTNSSTYTINSVATGNAGGYTCAVTGSCNTVTSNAALLTVEESPTITAQPANVKVCSGTSASFTVTATGTNIVYSWRKNGVPIQGANTPTFSIGSTTADDAGNYDCEITGKCQPNKTTNLVTLTVDLAPAISVQPKPTSACEGSNAFIYISATGTGISYSWLKDGTAIPNSNNDTLFLKTLKKTDQGFYSVNVNGTCIPEVNSQAATLTINLLPEIATQPLDQTVTEGSNVTFVLKANGSGLKYKWKKDGQVIAGKDSANLVLAKVKKTDAGNYICEVTNDCGTIASHDAKLTVNSAGAGPILSLSSGNVDFGLVSNGTNKDTVLTAIISNSGDQPLIITSFAISGTDAAQFSATGLTLPLTLQAGANVNLNISFSPTATGNKSAVIDFTTNGTASPKLNLEGIGYYYELQTNPTKVVLYAPIGQTGEGHATLVNNSSIDLNITSSIAGADASDFSFKDNVATFTLSKQTSKDIFVKYTSTKTSTTNAELVFVVNGVGQTVKIPLEGTSINSVESENLLKPVEIYPNPVSDFLEISVRANGRSPLQSDVRIMNIFGQTVLSVGVQNLEPLRVDISGLAPGMYFVRIGDRSGKFVKL
jgi:hypothetical protein